MDQIYTFTLVASFRMLNEKPTFLFELPELKKKNTDIFLIINTFGISRNYIVFSPLFCEIYFSQALEVVFTAQSVIAAQDPGLPPGCIYFYRPRPTYCRRAFLFSAARRFH